MNGSDLVNRFHPAVIGPIVLLVVLATGCGSPTDENTTSKSRETKTTRNSKQVRANDRPDTLPLISIMINLEREMQSISSGLWRHNFEQIAHSADNIANHAKIKRDEVKKIRKILGEDNFKAFVQDDKTVHAMATRLREAAGKKNFKKTAEFYQKLEQGCISCHLEHRSTIRQSRTW